MTITKLFAFTALSVAALSTSIVSAQDAETVKRQRLLPELTKMAQEDDCKVFNICEICDGVSETSVVRENIRCHNTYSIAKLFTCTVIGILQDQGLLDVDDPIYPIFEKKFPENFDPNWKEVTIANVIKHEAGFGTDELDIDTYDSAKWERDYLTRVLSQPLPNKPGTKFNYTDATFYLASRIVSEKTGKPLNQIMIKELLDPLQFSEYAFSTDPEGYPIGATGMYISTEDMAKLGLLYVQDGIYEGKRILSKEFVDEAFERNFELYPLDNEGIAFAKGGMNGQYLYMNRKTKRVVAIHSYRADIDALVKYILENDK